MSCDKELLVQAYADGELDPAAAVELERHLATCPTCPRLLEETAETSRLLRTASPYHRAPAGLRARIAAALDADAASAPPVGTSTGRNRQREGSRRRAWMGGALSGAAAAGIAAGIALLLLLPPDRGQLDADLVSAHLRSLVPDHLTDVRSSDRHTVKPWFAGHVDVSPPAADFAGQGFALVGGRADYVGGRPAAAVVYRKGAHVINLFAWRDDGSRLPAPAVENGYRLLFWRGDGMMFCAVSDVAESDLEAFAALVKGQLSQPGRE